MKKLIKAMKPEELKSGNFLSVNNDGDWTVQVIDYIAKDCNGFKGWFVKFVNGDICKFYNDPESEYFLFMPIKITEKWMIKFGFLKDGEYGWYKKEYYSSNEMVTEVHDIYINIDSGRLMIQFSGYIDSPFKKPSSVYGGCDIRYVHQLQNLYFALTGEELKVK